MSRQKLEQIVTTLALFTFGLYLVLFILIITPTPRVTQDKEEVLHVNDRPLLETVEQVYEARTTKYSHFRIGNEYYVVENLPKEYIDYSSWRVRMP